MNRIRTIGILLIVAAVAFAAGMVAEAQKPAEKPAFDDAALERMVQSFDKVEKIEFDWGWIRWLMNAELDPGAQMTFGLVELKANQQNPAHVHANCEEVLYVLSGSCEHRLGDRWVTLKKGDAIRIPQGVPHAARTLAEPMLAVITYNTGQRQFAVVEDDAGK